VRASVPSLDASPLQRLHQREHGIGCRIGIISKAVILSSTSGALRRSVSEAMSETACWANASANPGLKAFRLSHRSAPAHAVGRLRAHREALLVISR